MKKNFKKSIIALLCLFTVFCIQTAASPLRIVSAHPPRVTDEADLLTDSEEIELTDLLNEISERQQFDVVVAAVNSLRGYSIDQYSADFYDYGGYGMGENYDGAMLLISMDEREWFILTTGYGMEVLDDYDIDMLSDDIVPYLSDGDYAGAFEAFAEGCDEEITYENENGDDEVYYDEEYDDVVYEDIYENEYEDRYGDSSPSIFVALVIGLVIGFIPALIMRSNLKSVRMQSTAGNYEKRETRKITVRKDTFLYHTVNRVPHETQNRSSGSSGSRSSGGSRSFTGSSGRSHGGRGGGF